jgi:hypothetical protein
VNKGDKVKCIDDDFPLNGLDKDRIYTISNLSFDCAGCTVVELEEGIQNIFYPESIFQVVSSYKMNKNLERRDLMLKYAQMMLDRHDYHGLWDAAIDLQRLQDKLDSLKEKN